MELETPAPKSFYEKRISLRKKVAAAISKHIGDITRVKCEFTMLSEGRWSLYIEGTEEVKRANEVREFIEKNGIGKCVDSIADFDEYPESPAICLFFDSPNN